MVAMAAGPSGLLSLAFGLRLLLAAVLQTVSGDHLRGSPGRVGNVALRNTKHSVLHGSHTWRGWEDWASLATAATGMLRGFIPRLMLFLSRPGFLAVLFPNFRIS